MENRRAITEGWDTGLVGTIGVTLIGADGVEIAARSTAGITEEPAASGRYVKTVNVDPALYPIEHIWDDETDYASGFIANEPSKINIRDAIGGLWTDEDGNDFELTITDP